jgi:PII-like signaling protein
MRTTTPSRFAGRPATRLTLRLHARDRAGHHSLTTELLRRARHARLRGATAFEASAGYGGSGHVHRAGLVRQDVPVSVVIIDEPQRVDAFLRDCADLLDRVLVVVDDIEILDR